MNQLLARLQQLADSTPGHPVLESDTGVVTAIELLARAQELSLELHAMNISVLGLLCDNSVDWVVADLASQFESICLVPIPTFFSDSQVRYVVESAALDALLYDSGSVSRVAFFIWHKSKYYPARGVGAAVPADVAPVPRYHAARHREVDFYLGYNRQA